MSVPSTDFLLLYVLATTAREVVSFIVLKYTNMKEGFLVLVMAEKEKRTTSTV